MINRTKISFIHSSTNGWNLWTLQTLRNRWSSVVVFTSNTQLFFKCKAKGMKAETAPTDRHKPDREWQLLSNWQYYFYTLWVSTQLPAQNHFPAYKELLNILCFRNDPVVEELYSKSFTPALIISSLNARLCTSPSVISRWCFGKGDSFKTDIPAKIKRARWNYYNKKDYIF